MKSTIETILSYCSSRSTIRIGVVPDNGKYRYVITAVDPGGNASVISCGDDISTGWWRIPPIPIHTTMTDTKVSFITDTTGNEQADTWLDRNEERIVPPGYTADQIVNEWDMQDGNIVSATVTREALEQCRDSFPKDRFLLSSLTPPLWDLAQVYSSYIKGPFVIWKVTDHGSVLGYGQNGRLQALCHYWPDSDDLTKEGAKIFREAAPMIKSMTKGENGVSVVVLSTDKSGALASIEIPGYTVAGPPAIPGVHARYHEAYACSLHTGTHCDFASIHDAQNAESLATKRKLFCAGARYTVVTAGALLALMAISVGIINGIQNYTRVKSAPLQVYIEQIKQGRQTLDSLTDVYSRTAGFLGRESMVTHVLNELQTVFPDGVRAEQIEIAEISTDQWRIMFFIRSSSTALVPAFLGNLEKVRGVKNVRLIYSEQVTAPKGPATVKVRVECRWGK